MFEPVKIGFGQYMKRFFKSLHPTTKQMHEFCDRNLPQAIAWAPGRMVDSAEDMIGAWLKADVQNEKATAPRRQPVLPVILVAMDRNHSPSGRDYTRQIADEQWIMIPDDPLKRVYKLKLASSDIRIQIVIVSHDEPTARSIAAQFQLFVEESGNRRFDSVTHFAGIEHRYPCQLETDEIPALSIASESKNLTILALDLNLKCSVPIFIHPADHEAHDKTKHPFGYPVVVAENIHSGILNPEKEELGYYRIGEPL